MTGVQTCALPIFTFLHAGTGAKRTGSFRGAGEGAGGSKRFRLGRESPFSPEEGEECFIVLYQCLQGAVECYGVASMLLKTI